MQSATEPELPDPVPKDPDAVTPDLPPADPSAPDIPAPPSGGAKADGTEGEEEKKSSGGHREAAEPGAGPGTPAPGEPTD
ncbi:hypothetical protein M5362_12220 [Streptomyces sp. Je 1-79]|uniref:hypothetical protein n=1 Tax=Streptomyces sp. Je 1-79 TaxID=2943847 RepID=UPI0021A866D9|nr:hypothetical protein [Streptomyces sp. Je 1-79]MCT4353893.1 hypothetical protein [Streptomyces sp. Je 1-79]